MIKEAINRVLELADVELVDVRGCKYSDRQLHLINDPKPAPLVAHTLTGLVGYLFNDVDSNREKPLVLHVVSPTQVEILSFLSTPNNARDNFLSAQSILPDFPFDRFLSTEDFIIKLQTHFIQDDVVADLLKVVGNIADEAVTTVVDDGVSQQVTAKAGVARVEKRMVPRVLKLRPYRSFLEIEQPEGDFILRMKSNRNEGQLPSVGLFEADGGRWKLEAIQRVKAWLEENVTDISIIA